MLRLTWTQMRAAAGRLSAAAIAIVLGTAFVTTVLLASATMEETSHRALTASYADADVVLTNPEELTAADLAAVRAASEVSEIGRASCRESGEHPEGGGVGDRGEDEAPMEERNGEAATTGT